MLFDELMMARPRLPYEYYMWERGEYIPNEERPSFTIKGRRKWYAPWLRHPNTVYSGMSEADSFRLQKAIRDL